MTNMDMESAQANGAARRAELQAIAERLHEILQHERAGLSTDELAAVSIAMQLAAWVSRPPEEIRVSTHKASIAFGAIKLGG